MASASAVSGTLSNLANLGGSIYGLVNSSNLQGTANSATSNLSAIQSQQLGYAKQLQDLMSNPSSVTSLPGYQFLENQGIQAIDRSAAAPGGVGLGSGGEMMELDKYGQGLADEFYNQQVSTLGQLSGIPSSAQSLAEAIRNSGAASTSTGSSIQGLLNSLFGSPGSGGTGLVSSAVSALSKLFGGDSSTSGIPSSLGNLTGLDSIGYSPPSQTLGNLDLSLLGDGTNLNNNGAYTLSDPNASFDTSGADPNAGFSDGANSDLSSLFSGFNGAGGQAANMTAGQNANQTNLNTGQILGIGAGALGIGTALASGKPTGYASAAVQGAGLYGRFTQNADVSSAAGVGASALGLYQGLKTGGVAGDTEAAVSGARLATTAAADVGALSGSEAGALSSGLGYVAAPLALYNFAKNWQSGNTGSDAIGGAEAGAAIGSVVPVVGTILGGLIGGAVGAISSAFGGGEKDPETQNWDSFAPAFNKDPTVSSQLTPSSAYQLLAGVMDAKNNSAGHSEPVEQVFGRMGEGNLMLQMAGEINSAIASGTVSKSASPSQLMNQVVEPWLSSKGANVLGSQNTSKGVNERPALQAVLQSLIGFWQNGQLTASSAVGVSGENIAGLPVYGA